ncbi:hypothetical protein N656DRAFT_773516 [Canariomyces notabilis]|uniref:ATP-grasp domain-containing protein n=1 Tax=Canariomyces notabilis TaxID=2074819 RepID=A0AAN6TMU7_9PEZI|nr:hypothetical protein N656DRAFT_773516 [Canariomyces arenarius]
MGSIDPPPIKLPSIKLDTTLAELYKRASPKTAGLRLGLASCGVTSAVDLTPDFQRNSRYPYQDQALIKVPRRQLTLDNTNLRKSIAKKYLSLIPQRDAFIAGAMPVILFNLGQSPKQIEHDRREAETTISVLDCAQRPDLIFCPGPIKIPLQPEQDHGHGIDKLDYKVVLDGLEANQDRLTRDLETHWFLNSKAALARSGLPTPRSEILETEGVPPEDPESCCRVCAAAASSSSSPGSAAELPLFPAKCTGPRGRWLAAQKDRILSAARARPVPFVFKTQQAFGGAGTWLVRTAEQKSALLAELAGDDSDNDDDDGVLGKLLAQVTSSNAHLGPATVLLSELVGADGDGKTVVGDYGLTFVVTDRDDEADGGAAHFLAASEQNTDGSNAWIGSTISYPRQEQLRRKFEGLMRQTAAWLARYGYIGPVGVDVLEVKKSGSGQGETEFFIVDLNARISGSMSLPLLRGHFVGRGLTCASSVSIVAKGGRAGFIQRWRKPFEEGRMLILSWYEDPEAGESIAEVVIGGENEERLQELVQRVRENIEEVTL